MLKKVFVFLIAVVAGCSAKPPKQVATTVQPHFPTAVRTLATAGNFLAVYRDAAPVLLVPADGTLKLFDDHAHVAIMCRKFNVNTQKPSQCVVLKGGDLDEAMARIIMMLETSHSK
jgi:hypothetical protein